MRLMIGGVALVCLLGAIQAQSDSDELIKNKRIGKGKREQRNAGMDLPVDRADPRKPKRNPSKWQVNDIIVSTRYENATLAQSAFARFKAHLTVEEKARTKNEGKALHLIKEESNAWGDEGFVSDVRGSEAVAFRKGRFIVNVSVPQPGYNKDVFFSRQFAHHVLKALQDK